MPLIFTWPGPVLYAADALLHFLPKMVRLVLYSAAVSALSTLVYALISPQRQLRILADAQDVLRVRIRSVSDDFARAVPLAKENLRLAMRKVLLMLGPVMLSAYPALLILVWMEAAFSDIRCRFPPAPWLEGWKAISLGTILVCSLGMRRFLRLR